MEEKLSIFLIAKLLNKNVNCVAGEFLSEVFFCQHNSFQADDEQATNHL